MSEITECPSCGGPVVDAGGIDVRCLNCGFTFQDMFQVADSEEMVERLREVGIDPMDLDDEDYYEEF